MKTGKTTPKKIVDKNGKPTTVHVNDEPKTKISKPRDAALRAVVASAIISQEEETETLSFEEMRRRAKEIHPDARLIAEDGHWNLVIEDENKRRIATVRTNWAESGELPEIFKGTPAEYAMNQPESSYGNELDRWAYKNLHSESNIMVLAASYNIAVSDFYFRKQWAEEEAKKQGVRSPERMDELMSANKELNLQSDEFTDLEREIFRRMVDPDEEVRNYVKDQQREWRDIIDEWDG